MEYKVIKYLRFQLISFKVCCWLLELFIKYSLIMSSDG